MRSSRTVLAYLFITIAICFVAYTHVSFAATLWSQNNWIGGAGQNTWSDDSKFQSSSNISTSSANKITLVTQDSWFDTSWKYRQRVSITNSSGSTLTDYQVPMVINTASLVSSSKLKSDCADIRVTDATGSALPFWIATSPSSNSCNQNNTRIWVKLSTLSTSGGNIFVYYGKTDATSQSDGGNVFPVFVDFTIGSTLPTGWVKTDIGTSGNASVGSGYLAISNTNGSDVWVNAYGATHAYNNTKISGSFVAESLLTSQTNSDPWAKTGISVQNAVASGGGNGQAFIIATPGNGYDMQYQSLSGQGCTGGVCTGVIAPNQNTNSGSESLPTFFQLKKDASNQVSGYTSLDGTTWTKRGDTVAPWGVANDQYVTLFVTPHNVANTSTATYTFFYTRKYSAVEPVINSPTDEQTTYPTSGLLTSSIFDTGQPSNFYQLTYTASTSATISANIKVRSSSVADMSTATSFTSCSSVNSGSNLSEGGCVNNGDRYLQYQATLSSTDGLATPMLQSINIGYDAIPVTGQNTATTTTTQNPSINTTPICTDSAPIGIPDLFQIDMTQTNATVHFTPISKITRYYLSYSTENNAEGNGVEVNLGDVGVQSYSILSLSPGTKYNFKVRGQNGCMPGNWSNIKTATTKSSYLVPEADINTSINKIKEALSEEKKIDIVSQELTYKDSSICTYPIASGDSLWSIAKDKLGDGRRFGEIKELSGLKSSILRVGQEVKLPCDDTQEVAQKAKEEVTQQGVKLAVLVKDIKDKPLEGVTVTLHSVVQVTKTNKDGVAQFENVEPGDHKVLLAYNNYNGEQSLKVDSTQKNQTLTLQVQMTSGFSSPQVILALGVMTFVIVVLITILLVVLYKARKH